MLPGAAERRAATNTRMAEEAFYQLAEKIATLPLAEIAERTQGASVVYKDPLSPLFATEKKPEPLAYAVISVRRGGSRSPLSNIVALAPDVAPEAPVLLPAMPLEGRICLDWLAPQNDVLGRPVEIGGYEVYRRILPEEEYDRPLNPKPIAAVSYVDAGAPYGAPLVYTVRAVLAKNPKVEGLPAEELAVMYRDVYPPGAPARLDALSEGNRVRLVWSPVDAAGSGRLPRVPRRGDRGAGAPDEGPGRRSVLHRRDGRAGQALSLHRRRDRPGGQPEPGVAGGGRRAVLSLGARPPRPSRPPAGARLWRRRAGSRPRPYDTEKRSAEPAAFR